MRSAAKTSGQGQAASLFQLHHTSPAASINGMIFVLWELQRLPHESTTWDWISSKRNSLKTELELKSTGDLHAQRTALPLVGTCKGENSFQLACWQSEKIFLSSLSCDALTRDHLSDHPVLLPQKSSFIWLRHTHKMFNNHFYSQKFVSHACVCHFLHSAFDHLFLLILNVFGHIFANFHFKNKQKRTKPGQKSC